MDEVTALSRAIALDVPIGQAIDAKEGVAFFQEVKAWLEKFNLQGDGRSQEEIETAFQQVIEKALVSDQVLYEFDDAGLNKPDISILSDEFMAGQKGMELMISPRTARKATEL